MKVLITEKIAEDGINILKKGFDVDVKLGLSPTELLEVIGDYDALIVRSATKVTSEVIKAGKKLKVVGRAGTGVDNIDLDAATMQGVIVINTPGGNSVAAAELTIGLIFSIFRSIPQAYAAGKRKFYSRNSFKGYELYGKTAGVIGLGRIGTLVAKRLKAMEMHVIGYDPYVQEEYFKKMGIKKCQTLEELLKKSDLITIHIAKTKETTNLLDEKEFSIMKDGVRIVNCARGGIINEKALYNALVSGKVAAAGLDVLEKEPKFELPPEEQTYDNPLLELDNVVYLPHLGASTIEAQYNVGLTIAKEVDAALRGEMVSAVNMPAVPSSELETLKPYLHLAENLGKIYFQAEKNPVSKIEIIYSGEVANKNTKVITLAFLKGLLTPITSEKVNYVNAEKLVKNLGIEIVESTTKEARDYTSLITARFYNGRQLDLAGTVLDKRTARITDFFGYYINFEPTPYVLAVQNVDQPGVIGSLGTILGSEGINIAAMQVSRNKKGEKAEAFLSVDCEIPENILAKIREIEGVLKATMLRFD
ncbi:MAG TPA: phosphoglycerate dehydrogenase [Clostridiaceae bacterium]|nr:phosphoglycerate dehydrogenase [Clostridiaceae bacterium]